MRYKWKFADWFTSDCLADVFSAQCLPWQQTSSQVNPNPTNLNQAPANGGTSTSPLNPVPTFNEAPYNRSQHQQLTLALRR